MQEGNHVDQVPPNERLEGSDQHSRWRRLSRGDRQAVTIIGGIVGLLSGVAQFLGSYFQSGLTLLLASAAALVGGLALTFAVMRGWRAGQRKVALSINTIVLVVLALLVVGGLGGAVGRSIGILARQSPITTPSPTTTPFPTTSLASAASLSPTSSPSPTPMGEKLSYEISASPAGPRTVEVTAKASGELQPRMTYWFVLEVDYGKGYSEYYPRRKMTGGSESFEVSIPDGADTKYTRNGRIYALNSVESDQAADKFQRQGATGVNDFFDHVIGQPVSNEVRLPY